MKSSSSLLLASSCFLVAALSLFSCGEPLEVPVSEGTETSYSATGETTPVDMAEAEPAELDVTIGGVDLLLEEAVVGLERDGRIVEAASVESGDPLIARIIAREVPEGLVGRVVWSTDDEIVAEEQKPIPADTRTVSFELPASVTPGTHTVELYLGGNLVHSSQIRID